MERLETATRALAVEGIVNHGCPALLFLPTSGAIVCAVEQERSRLDREGVAPTEPQTELGRDVKDRTDMPTILIDRLVRKHATKTLKNVKDRGKPS